MIVIKVPTQVGMTEKSVIRGAELGGVANATAFNLASTAGLNALITRNMPKIGFLTTKGHRDILDRGSVARPGAPSMAG